MCIRDSANHEQGYLELACEYLRLSAFQEAQQIIERGLRVCLLYTSDAADERSSVDLGGRRIIKKKKQDMLLD